MKREFLVTLMILAGAGYGGCGSNSAVGIPIGSPGAGNPGGSGTPSADPVASAPNVLPITVEAVNTGVCSLAFNIPCTSVTICQHNSSNCQTISDILVDTGSPGLRIFQSLINVQMVQTGTSANPIAECAQFADTTAAWGPIELVDVQLGSSSSQKIGNLPVQVILDPTVGRGVSSAFSSACGSNALPLDTPANAGFNGILGLSVEQVDTSTTSGPYFTCLDPNCVNGPPSAVIAPNPLRNPVPLLPVDNNGIILTFPSVPASGAVTVSGSLILGIGTESNNRLSASAQIYPISAANITMEYQNTSYQGFFDTGSNFLAFPDSILSTCTDPNLKAFYCTGPGVTVPRTASLLNQENQSIPISFQVTDVTTLNQNFNVFNDIGGPSAFSGFDWGFPIFLGRTIYLSYAGSGYIAF